MAGTKEIRTKIKSVQNTRKITKAMEMVAASKGFAMSRRIFRTPIPSTAILS
jgi:F0F1-type ATP synthase gamma subunit